MFLLFLLENMPEVLIMTSFWEGQKPRGVKWSKMESDQFVQWKDKIRGEKEE